ncbi:MAG: helix-turn-helix transcriptional regulator [Alphaproteobacteria bacterium]
MKPQNPIDIAIGTRMRFARILKGVNLEDIWRYTAISPAEMKQIEAGLLRAGPKRLMDLSHYLALDMSYLFTGNSFRSFQSYSANENDPQR